MLGALKFITKLGTTQPACKLSCAGFVHPYPLPGQGDCWPDSLAPVKGPIHRVRRFIIIIIIIIIIIMYAVDKRMDAKTEAQRNLCNLKEL